MARIRSIHPGLFTDEAFMAASAHARVLLIGLWTEADDQGVFEWKPLTLKARLLPADMVDLAVLLAELETLGQVLRFAHEGKPYGALKNFRKYQRPQKPTAVHPLPESIAVYVGLSATAIIGLSEQSATPTGNLPQMEDEGGRRKEKPSGSNEPSGEGARTQAIRLPEGWKQNAEDVAYAKALGMPDDAIDRDVSKFRNHYQGNGQERVDWSAAWRKWIDGTCEKAGYKPALVSIVGKIPSIAIGRKDARWKPCADRWEREHGEAPKSVQSAAYPDGSKLFPSDWEETRISAEAAA